MATPTNEPRYNERIRAREVRLIGADGAQIGIKPLPEALAMARERDLDLVEVAPLANPPVCRIMDYGKFRYEESQRLKESRKKATHISIKEVKFRPKIGKGDFDTKVRHMTDFLNEGHKVKVTLQFRGREMAHPELGSKILDGVLSQIGPLAKVEASARLEGRNMTMVLSPDKKAAEAAELAAKKAAEEAAESAEAAAAAAAGGTVPAPADVADVATPVDAEATVAEPTDAEPSGTEPTDTETDAAEAPAAELAADEPVLADDQPNDPA